MNSTRWANPPPRNQSFLDSRKAKSWPAMTSRGGGPAGPGLGRQFRPSLRQMGQSFRQTNGTEPNRSCSSEQLWRRRGGVGRTGPYGQETQRGVQRKPCWYGNSCRRQSCPFAHFDSPPRTWGTAILWTRKAGREQPILRARTHAQPI